MIAISATSQNWEKNKIGKTCCQQVRSFLVRFVSFFVRFVIFLVGFPISLSHSLFTPSAAAAPPHPLHSIYLGSNSKFTFIRQMKKSKLLMIKKETRIVHIHSANEEKKERTPDEEDTRIAHIHSVNGRREKNSSHSFSE
jgi:hypothetical protein